MKYIVTILMLTGRVPASPWWHRNFGGNILHKKINKQTKDMHKCKVAVLSGAYFHKRVLA